ncbi:hypothetical protein ONE63_009581 [Megalurothrips usitatus]|uniref:Uncharacterized protein n=1 Tax=Megalurothrips usitatus TaxID=439358 RepID=A0AAV7XPU3_9NEOP|nr:hypothetical protein ONE63_009581 [Megalurothrips usitatus]
MKVILAVELFSSTNVNISLELGEEILPGSTINAMVIKDVDQMIDLTFGHSSTEARTGNVKYCRQSIDHGSPHSHISPQLVEKLRKARFCKVDPRTGQRKYVANSPTLKNWASTAESITALADIGKQYGKKLNPRVGVRTDSLESDFEGYKAHGNPGNKLTPAMAMASLKAMLIRGLVVPDNPHSNVESTALGGAGIEFDDGADSANTNPVSIAMEQVRFGAGVVSNETIANRFERYDDLILARNLRGDVLQGVAFKTCNADWTASSTSQEYQDLHSWDPSTHAAPSAYVVQHMKTASNIFVNHCRGFAHVWSIQAKVLKKLKGKLQCTWLTCPVHKEERMEAAITWLARKLILDFCSRTVDCPNVKKRAIQKSNGNLVKYFCICFAVV